MMTPRVLRQRYVMAIVFFLVLGLGGYLLLHPATEPHSVLTGRPANILSPTLKISPREDQLDREQLEQERTHYKTVLERALRERTPEICSQLPELLLPYRRGANGNVRYISSQKDGPNVPERLSYWPRKECLFAYSSNMKVGGELCSTLFLIPEEQADCRSASERRDARFQTLEDVPDDIQPLLGKKSFYSSNAKQQLSYYILYPSKPVAGILIYLHGAGGGLEQGQLDGTYKDSFKKLKQLLKNDLSYLYVTPSLTNYGAAGGQDANDLAAELHTHYPGIPIYLAGSSAGGRTLFYAIKQRPSVFEGAIALCPAINSELATTDWRNQATVPLWIMQGDHDPLVPVEIVDQFVERLKQQGYPATYTRLPGGDHGAPIDQIDWKVALESFQRK
jgi:pimeloyl-ACP methyl ester carboxylesterase